MVFTRQLHLSSPLRQLPRSPRLRPISAPTHPAIRGRQPASLALALHRRSILPFLTLLPLLGGPLACTLRPAATAPMSSSPGQDRLVDALKAEGVVRHGDVEAALRGVDRAAFVGRQAAAAFAYHDTPLPIGHGETISAPHMHATCLELLRGHLRPGARVLDVGSGSGYLTAAMALMVRPGGKVIGIEKHPELARESVAALRRGAVELVEEGAVEVRAGNVLGDALAEEGPEAFDAIHVGAAADRLPEVLVGALRRGGRMVIPVGPQWEHQVMQVIDKDEGGRIKKHNLMAVRYVPLTRPGEE